MSALLDEARAGIEQCIRPSNLWRLALCEGAALMSAAVTAQGTAAEAAPEADLGCRVHAMVEECAALSLGLDGTLAHAVAASEQRAVDAGLDSWSARCVRSTLEFYAQLMEKYGVEPDNVLLEYPLDMSGCGMARKGTSDLVLVVPGKLVVIADLKAGFLDQGDADDHDQTATYAAAAAVQFQCEEVHTYLWQPRVEKEHRCTAARYEAKQLRAAAAWACSVTELARNDNPRLTGGYLQCATCPALLRCAEAKRFIMDAIEALEILGEPLDADGWGEACGAAKLAEKWAEVWKDKTKAHLKAGGEATGFKLGNPRAMQFVNNVPLAITKLRESGMETELFAACSIKVGSLSPEARTVIADNIDHKLSEPSLVADKRAKASA